MSDSSPIRPPGDYVKDAVDRLKWTLNPLNLFKFTPFQTGGDQDPEQRRGWQDIGHAITNLPVEWARANPKAAGKTLFFGGLAVLAGFVTIAVNVIRAS